MRRTRLALLLLLSIPVIAIVLASNAPADRKAEIVPSREQAKPTAPPSPTRLADRLVTKPATKVAKSNRDSRPPQRLDQLPHVPAGTPGKQPTKKLTPEEAQRMALLMDIWKRQGGDIFSGTIFENQGKVDEEFANALRRVMTKARDEQQQEKLLDDEQEERLWLSRQEEEAEDSVLFESLQSSCRLLDAKANELEAKRQYKEADKLRKLANKLRKTARKYDR